MRIFTVEVIGTFFLVCGAILGGAVGASLALMVMIYAGGHISGAHYNPAVSISMLIRGKINGMDLVKYMIAQFLGAILAAVVILYVFDVKGTVDCDLPSAGLGKVLMAEFLGTFALAYVVLNVATARGTANNSYFGLAIAGTVLGMATLFGAYSGGVFNPAVGVGVAMQKSICWNQVWVYFVAPIAAGIVAAYTFLAINGADEKIESIPDDVLKTSDKTIR